MLDLGCVNLRGIDWEGGHMDSADWVGGTCWTGSDVGGDGSTDSNWCVGNLVNNWGSGNGHRSNGGWSDWEVGGGNSESVNWVSNVVDSLGESISINVAVASSHVSSSVLRLALGGWTSGISV
jgi:hypothetical protein